MRHARGVKPALGHGPRASNRPGGSAAKAAGFTLLEVLLATALLAAGLALAFATVRAAGATATRGEAMAERNERIRAVSSFLRRRIGGAQATVFELDDATGVARRFEGDAAQMRFVADLPDYLGRGGPHLHTLSVRDGALRVDVAMVQGGAVAEANRVPAPEALADGLRSVAFDYRRFDADGVPGPWQADWQHAGALPAQVRVRIRDAGGPWPDMVVALPLAPSFAPPPEPVP